MEKASGMQGKKCEEEKGFFFSLKFYFIRIYIGFSLLKLNISQCSLLQAEGRMKRSCKFTEFFQVRSVTANCRTVSVIRLCHVKAFLSINIYLLVLHI